MEKELGSARDTTKILNGLIEDDIPNGHLYVVSSLRALYFLSKNETFKKQLDKLMNELLATQIC